MPTTWQIAPQQPSLQLEADGDSQEKGGLHVADRGGLTFGRRRIRVILPSTNNHPKEQVIRVRHKHRQEEDQNQMMPVLLGGNNPEPLSNRDGAFPAESRETKSPPFPSGAIHETPSNVPKRKNREAPSKVDGDGPELLKLDHPSDKMAKKEMANRFKQKNLAAALGRVLGQPDPSKKI